MNNFFIKEFENFIYGTKNIYEVFYNNTKNKNIITKSKINSYIDEYDNIEKSKPSFFIINNEKMIPSTKLNMMYFILIYMFGYNDEKNTIMMFNVYSKNKFKGITSSDYTTINLLHYFSNYITLSYIRKYTTIPENIYHFENSEISYLQNIKFSLLNENIERIYFINSKQLIDIFELIIKYRDEIVDDIMKIDVKRGEIIRNNLFDKTNYRKIFLRLWKKIKLIVLDFSERIYLEKVKYLFGDTKLYNPILNIYYDIGYDLYQDNTYILDFRYNFYEFINVNDKNNKILNVSELIPNNFYILLISNDYHTRLNTKNILLFIEKYNNSGRFKYVCEYNDIIIKKDKIIYPYEIENIVMETIKDINYFCYSYKNNKMIIYLEYCEKTNIDHKSINKMKELIKNKFILSEINVYILKDKTFDKYFNKKVEKFNINIYSIRNSKRIFKESDKKMMNSGIVNLG